MNKRNDSVSFAIERHEPLDVAQVGDEVPVHIGYDLAEASGA
jgi:hypothetical protein